MEKIYEAFGEVSEAMLNFYANPSHEALTSFVKTMNTLHGYLKALPHKDMTPPS